VIRRRVFAADGRRHKESGNGGICERIGAGTADIGSSETKIRDTRTVVPMKICLVLAHCRLRSASHSCGGVRETARIPHGVPEGSRGVLRSGSTVATSGTPKPWCWRTRSRWAAGILVSVDTLEMRKGVKLAQECSGMDEPRPLP
jgi:hypothetical protein